MPAFDEVSVVFLITFFVSFYSLGAYAVGREQPISVVLAILGVAYFVATDGDPFQIGDVVFGLFLVGGPWAAGLVIRLRQQRVRECARRTPGSRRSRRSRPVALSPRSVPRLRASCTTSSRTRSPSPSCSLAVRADARHRRGGGAPRTGRDRADQHRGAERHATLAGCAARAPSPTARGGHDSPATVARPPGPALGTRAKPGVDVDLRTSGNPSPCRPVSTCRRTGSSRRRSPTCSSTPGRGPGRAPALRR